MTHKVLHPEMESEIRGLLSFPPRILSESAQKAYEKGMRARNALEDSLPVTPPGRFPPPLIPPPPTFIQAGRIKFTRN